MSNEQAEVRRWSMVEKKSGSDQRTGISFTKVDGGSKVVMVVVNGIVIGKSNQHSFFFSSRKGYQLIMGFTYGKNLIIRALVLMKTFSPHHLVPDVSSRVPGVPSKVPFAVSPNLNEVQNNLAEPLESMNLENLLENVFPHQEVNQSALEDLEISRFVSKNTVDEEWRENQQQKKGDREPQRQVSLGEMTLEDFLVNARVEVDGSGKISHSTRESQWLQQQTQQCMMGSYVPSRPVKLPTGIGANNASPLSNGPKRVAGEEMAEKALERRKKRMIKNRESAARSRIRKQAYTSELENIILRLEEENERLKKEKELDTLLHCVPLPEPKQQLRRSISAPL
ncbi:ABSCISIC ACID-INSENSITIVE 5-like protein 3 [Dendrobium catenatum]|uniref:ABSCISIC ACID-INSENSITIVE 5-like protein 3 n=1 Tax=Dendrobium catenatum TaxID=906689 RepID=UPI00109F9E87|nr:ABSCISIC ACID-INSENSITIVE 5-like protein 3 [Dendrobium catenatum]